MSTIPESAVEKAADALVPHVGFGHSEIAARAALDAAAPDIVRAAARRLLAHDDEIDRQTAAGYWMQLIHGGDTDKASDWDEAFTEADKVPNRDAHEADVISYQRRVGAVEALRDCERRWREPSSGPRSHVGAAMRRVIADAFKSVADEIEAGSSYVQEIDRLEAEVERLRQLHVEAWAMAGKQQSRAEAAEAECRDRANVEADLRARLAAAEATIQRVRASVEQWGPNYGWSGLRPLCEILGIKVGGSDA